MIKKQKRELQHHGYNPWPQFPFFHLFPSCLCICSSAHLWLRGEHDAPIAYIEAAIFGNEDHVGFDAFTYEITKAFAEILGIRPDRVYIKFEDIGVWGVGGMCIDRNMYR